MQNKHLLVTFLILLGGMGASLAVYFLSPTLPPTAPSVVDEQKQSSSTEKLKPTELKPALLEQTKFKDATTLPEEKNLLPVRLIVNDKIYETKIAIGSNVYDLMKKLNTEQSLQFVSKTYPSLGQFVEEINGVKNNKQKGIYWIFYINNQPSQLGISSYILKPNDLITWKYETAQF